MHHQITSVYIPVKTPESKAKAWFFSIFTHFLLIGVFVYYYQSDKPMVIETVMVTPEQLADIQQQIKANQQSQQNQYQTTANVAKSTQASMSEVLGSQTFMSDSSKPSKNQQMMQAISEKELAWQQEKEKFNQQLEQQAEQRLQDVLNEIKQSQREEANRLKELHQAENNIDAITEQLRKEMQEAQQRNQKRIDEATKSQQNNQQSLSFLANDNTRQQATGETDTNSYQQQIISKIYHNWETPTNSAGRVLKANIKISPNGQVTNISIMGTSDEVFANSLKQAIQQSSPLPVPSDPNLYRQFASLTLSFKAK